MKFQKKYIIIILLLLTALTNLHGESGSLKYSPPSLISPANNAKFQPSKNLELRWSEIPGNNMYRVEYATDTTFSGSGLKGTFVVSGNSIVMYEMEKNTFYFWRVRLETETIWSAVWKFKTTSSPSKPKLFAPLNNSSNLQIPIKFVWSSDSVNISYLLQISERGDFLSSKTITVRDTMTTDNFIQYGKSYYWRVKGLNSDYDESDWSDSMRFKTKLAPPLLYTPLDYSNNNDTTIKFSWGEVQQATNYKIEIATDSLFSAGTIVLKRDTSASVIEVKGLNFQTNYYWHVYAYNSAGDFSDWSDTVTFRTKFPMPTVSSPADSSKDLDTAITFTWQSLQDAYKYRLQIASDSLFAKKVFDTLTSATSAKVESLLYSRQYFWRVNARNKTNDTSSWSAQIFFTTQLQKPILLFPKNDSTGASTNIDLSWTKPDSAVLYRLQLSTDSLFVNKTTDSLTKKNNLLIKYLFNDTTYYWRVKALRADSINGSKWASFNRFKTRPSLIISPQIVNDTINLSEIYTDTVSSILVTNFGVNQFRIDKALVYPDTTFYLSKQSAVAMPGSETIFTIRFNPEKVRNGVNSGKAYFIRKNINPKDDTVTVDLSLYIKKAKASFIPESITFGNAYANNTYIRSFLISNKDGNTDLKIKNCVISGTDTASFKLLDTLKSIPGGEEKYLRVSFKPKRTAKHTALLSISTNSYKDTLSEFVINGYGMGGELDNESISSISNVNASEFETFSSNNKKIQIRNKGNSLINLNFTFRKNYFNIDNEYVKTVSLYPEDSVGLTLKYITPNLRKLNIDTMFVVSDGFSKDTLMVILKGGFDSLQAKARIIDKLKINGTGFSSAPSLYPDYNRIVFTLPSDIFSAVQNASFRIKYFTGGAAKEKVLYSDGNNNFIIPANDVNYSGLIYKAEFILLNKFYTIIDSLEVVPFTDAQVSITFYQTPKIYVPRSKPAEKAENADVKWKLIGFPFENTFVDSVFSYFGGRNNIKDGEWILYKYAPENKDGFVQFFDPYFEPYKGYFVAQALTDSFAVSYKYPENLKTRKLSDTLITFKTNGWKTISSPFTFEVGINSDIPLRKYDTYKKAYTMTYIMNPGEAYFVEPSVDFIHFKTFGNFVSLDIPKIISDIGWHVKIVAENEIKSKELLLAIDNSVKSTAKRNSSQCDFADAPSFVNGYDLYIKKENSETPYTASVQNSAEGSVWDLVLKGYMPNSINLTSVICGSFPSDFIVTLLDEGKPVKSGSEKIFIGKGEDKNIKVIIGTADYTKRMINTLTNNIITDFSLCQNHPNPFNPVTIIKYSIPNNESGSLKKVELKVFNTLGKEVATLVDEYKNPGNYHVEFNGAKLASGVYFYRLAADGKMITKKMLLIK